MTWRLTAKEDAELRRLHALIRFANGGSLLSKRYRRLRARDRRSEVREVRSEDLVHEVAIPYPAAPADRTSQHIDGAGPRV
jgi:hypothetical protein